MKRKTPLRVFLGRSLRRRRKKCVRLGRATHAPLRSATAALAWTRYARPNVRDEVEDAVVVVVVDEVAEGLVVMTATTDHETADGVAEVVGEAECVSRLFRSQNPN